MRRFGEVHTYTSKWKQETRVSARMVIVYDPSTPAGELVEAFQGFEQTYGLGTARCHWDFHILDEEAPGTISLVGGLEVVLDVEAGDPLIERVRSELLAHLSGHGFDVSGT